jgi:hypothetical protein
LLSPKKSCFENYATEKSFRLAFWGFYVSDEGHIYHSHPVAASRENYERATVWSKVREVSRRYFAGPAIGEADCEWSKWRCLEVFCYDFFGHRMATLSRDVRSMHSV